MRRKILVVTLAFLFSLSLVSCNKKDVAVNDTLDYDNSAKILTEAKTTQFFTDEKVSEKDMKMILSAGVNAPSAMNTQPWHFTAVTDAEVNKKLSEAMKSMKPPAMKDGKPADMPPMPKNTEGEKTPENMPKDAPKPPEGGSGFSKMPNKAGIGDAPLTIVISCKEGSELDAGLAVQNMSAEAQLLGYGTKIMTAPTMALNNKEYKEMLSVPEGQKIVAVLIAGKPATEEENPDAITSATERNDFNDVVTIISK